MKMYVTVSSLICIQGQKQSLFLAFNFKALLSVLQLYRTASPDSSPSWASPDLQTHTRSHMLDTWEMKSVGLISTCEQYCYRVPFRGRKKMRNRHAALTPHGWPSFHVCHRNKSSRKPSCSKTPLPAKKLVRLLEDPLPTFHYIIFSCLWLKQIIFFFEEVCGLLTRL